MFFLHQAKIYIKGGEDFCSTADPGKLSLIGTVNVPPNDAKSVSVAIVPKIIGEIEVEVASVFKVKLGDALIINAAADSVRRKLLVVVRMIGHSIGSILGWLEMNKANSFTLILSIHASLITLT